jgi:exodeoxyribonuclease VII large subunit
VSELNRKAKSLLENQLGEVCVEAEIGDLSKPSSGHWYFTLKDARAQLRCAMFRRANVRVRFQPKLGDSVVVRGLLSIYEARGDYQLIVDDMQASGDGALQRELEALKQRLQAEGLFASDRKLPVPIHCERIGVITSPTGAAIEDIISVLGRRSPSSEIALFPVPVQGSGAAQQIADTIDVLIVGRGGGSLEDLWSFNEEVVARAIARSNIPIVSAVGHEIDYSIADFVADVRAATPSQAAELVTRDSEEWLQHIDSQAAQLNMLVQRKLAAQQASLAHLKARLRHPRHRLNLIREQLKSARDRAALLIQQRLTRERQIVNQIRRDLRAVSPTMITRKQKDTVARLHQQLPSLIAAVLNRQTDRVMHLTQLLTSLGPASTLERGYAIVTSVNEGVVRDSKTVSVDSEITIRLHRGGLTSVITETHDEPKPA